MKMKDDTNKIICGWLDKVINDIEFGALSLENQLRIEKSKAALSAIREEPGAGIGTGAQGEVDEVEYYRAIRVFEKLLEHWAEGKCSATLFTRSKESITVLRKYANSLPTPPAASKKEK
jgi:hypothetical protein